MALTKLHIQPQRQTPDGLEPSSDLSAFDVPFNPTSYSIAKSVSWSSQTATAAGSGSKSGSECPRGQVTRELDAPPLQFGGGNSRTLTLELFFDVSEEPVAGQPPRDVRNQTNRIVALTRIARNQETPPICELTWGEFPEGSDFPFVGVATNLTQNFVMFDPSGRPVRARLTVVFTEYNEPERNRRQNDPELTTHRIQRGDTLASIAARWYSDPRQWRLIAASNGIDDPRRLDIGSRLTIPKLR